MSAITAIQSGSSQFILPSRKYKAPQAEETVNRNTGPDTASISEEARQMALYGEIADSENGENEETLQETMARSEKPAKTSATIEKKSIFAMLMESLLLAELEESGAGGSGAQEDAQADTAARETAAQARKSASPMEDGDKVAQLKKVINDFMNGKADLSDLPKAMAVGKTGAGNAGSVAGKAAQGANAPDGNNSEKQVA